MKSMFWRNKGDSSILGCPVHYKSDTGSYHCEEEDDDDDKKTNLLHACPTAGLNTRLDTKTCFVIRLGRILNLTR